MADEATIKIEVEGSSGGGGASAASESAGGKLRSQEDILQSILGGEEGLLGSLKNPGKAFKGATEDLLKNYVSDVFGGGSAFSKMIGGGGSGVVEGAEAVGVTAGATATSVGGEAAVGGAVAGTAGALAAFTGALGPAGIAIAGLTAVYGVATAAVVGFAEVLTSVYQSLTQTWKPISGEMAAADARKQVELLYTSLETKNQVEGGYSAVTGAETTLEQTLMELKADFSEIFAPAVLTFITGAKILLIPIKLLVEAAMPFLRIVTDFIYWLNKTIDDVLDKLPDWIYKATPKQPPVDAFSRMFEDILISDANAAGMKIPPPQRK